MPRSKSESHLKQEAEARFHELVDELKLLTATFPHLKDAFDPQDDLPIPFLLKRGADRADRKAARAAKPVTRRRSKRAATR